jgi:hypothetical protein
MKAQFSGALTPAARGDVAGFASALKKSHYYTASETDYAHGLTSLMNAPAGGGSTTANRSNHAFAATELGLSSSTLSRVSDVLDAERWLGSLSPSSSSSSSHASSSSSSSRVLSASDDDDDS